ncbi:polymer-forming cytoskeletal protein [Roseococcus sp. DSY-14]|uniref:bactofilin family protein n=1 Tax=Roseococcus sp. DSY-14 TaxID=3369650 RepID=UPI00387B8ED7
MSIFGRKKDDGTDAPEAGAPAAPREDLAVPTFRAPAANSAPVGMPPRPAAPPPAAGAPRPAAAPGAAPRPATQDRRTLVVGRGISLQGTVADAERLVVEGTVESQMIQAAELDVAQTGVFRGEVQVEDAVIAGVFDGTVTARGNLIIRATGTVKGVARCKRLSVEEGGKIMGSMEMLQGEA